MSGKQEKRIKRAVKQAQGDAVEIFRAFMKWPLRQRIRLAWMLIKGR